MEVSGILHNLAAFCRVRNQYTLNMRLGRLRAGLSVLTKRKTLLLPGFKPQFIQFIAYSLYYISTQLKLKLYVNRQHSGGI